MGVIILKKFKIFVSLFTTFALCFTLTLCTSPVSAKSLTVIKPAVRIGHVSKPFWGLAEVIRSKVQLMLISS